MLLQDIKSLRPGKTDLRKFGLLVGGVFLLLGIWFFLRHKPAAPYLAVPGLLLVILGLAVPGMLKHLYLAWMTLALVLGFVVSHVILTAFFFLVVTPIGWAARLAGKDFLRLGNKTRPVSYWIKRDPDRPLDPASYERQF